MEITDKLSDHFSLEELIRSDTAEREGIDNTPPNEIIPKLRHLCEEILEPVRNHYGIPFSPSSGYRSRKLNDAIRGSQNSQHCLGEAVDFELPGIGNFELATWIRDNLDYDQLILEKYQHGKPNSGWVHVSLRMNIDENRKEVLTQINDIFRHGLVA